MTDKVMMQTFAVTADAMGGQDAVWRDVMSRWALVEPMALNERVQAERVIGEVSHRVTMRAFTRSEANQFEYLTEIGMEQGAIVYDAGHAPESGTFVSGGVVKLSALIGFIAGDGLMPNAPEFRLLWRDVPLSIASIVQMGNRGEYMQFMCREVQP